jgi:hypothetical protein
MTVFHVKEKEKSEAINQRTDNILVKSAHVVTSIKQSPVLEVTVKSAHLVTSIKQSPVLRGHLFLVLS